METRLMKSLLNQADFCLSTRQIWNQLNQLQNLRGEIFYCECEIRDDGFRLFTTWNSPSNAKYDHTFM